MHLMQDNYNYNFLIAIFVVLNCSFTDYKINNTELKIKAARLLKLFNAAYADGALLKYKAAWHRRVEWTKVIRDPFFNLCLF